jgi:putative acetyltransferase
MTQTPEKMKPISKQNPIYIERWNGSEEHARLFDALNTEWLEEFYTVEPADAAMLGNPKGYVIDPGGDILYARVNGEILGVVALLKLDNGVYELSKMGVTKKARGMGIGRKLAEALIAMARERNIPSLYICSSTKLAQAIELYKKLGFKETKAGADSRYKRADITLEMSLTPVRLDPTRYGDWEIAGKCVDF